MEKRKSSPGLWTVPNAVTLLGIVAIAIYVFEFLIGKNSWIFITIFFVGCSDALDGYLARRLGQSTGLGAFLDKLRDRLLLLAFFGNLIWIFGVDILFGYVGLTIFTEIFFNTTRILAPKIFPGRELDNTFRHHVGKLRQAVHLTMMGLVVLFHYYPFLVEVTFYDYFQVSIESLAEIKIFLAIIFYSSLINFSAYIISMAASLKK